jgi:hypothetical protein
MRCHYPLRKRTELSNRKEVAVNTAVLRHTLKTSIKKEDRHGPGISSDAGAGASASGAVALLKALHT